MLTSQKGVCAICGKTPHRIRLSVDHDHESRKVRGLLCSGKSCNYLLGRLRDNVEWMQSAVNYLMNPPAVDAIGERLVPEKQRRKKRATRIRKG